MSTWSKYPQWYKENSEKVIENNSDYKAINKVRHYAHKDLYKAVRDGFVTKPKVCPKCGNKKVEALFKRIQPYVIWEWSCRACNGKYWAGKGMRKKHE